MGSNMGEPAHVVHCAGFWDALVLKDILEEHGVQVPPPQENVFLTLTASGPLDVINAAVAELTGKYQSSWPVTVDAWSRCPLRPGPEPSPDIRPPPIRLHPPPRGSVSPSLPSGADANCPPYRAAPPAPSTPAERRHERETPHDVNPWPIRERPRLTESIPAGCTARWPLCRGRVCRRAAARWRSGTAGPLRRPRQPTRPMRRCRRAGGPC